AALIALASNGDATAPHYQWARPMLAASSRPFEASAFLSLVSHVSRGRHPLVLATGPNEDAEPTLVVARAYLRGTPVRSAAVIRAGVGAVPRGTWVLGWRSDDHGWSEPVIEHLQLLGDHAAAVLQRRDSAREAGASEADAPPAAQRPQPAPHTRTPFS